MPALGGEAMNAVNTSQLESGIFPTIPVSPLFSQPPLEPVGTGLAPVWGATADPSTSLQGVPATPFLWNVPATPVHPHSSQGGLLTQYNATRSIPRRIALRPTSGTTAPHRIFARYSEGGAEPQANPHTETRHQPYRNEGTQQ